MIEPVTLYAAPVSLFSGKARAYLLYKRVPFTEVMPSQQVIMKVIRPKTGIAMVPVVVTKDDEAIQDTSVIIDFFEAQVAERPVIPATPRQRLVSQLLELYADEWLLLPAMSYRWIARHIGFLAREFGGVVAPDSHRWLQPFRGLPLVAYFGLGHGPVLGVNRKTRPAIVVMYEKFLATFDAHLAVHPYVLGAQPTLANFGLMGPLYAHLYRDPRSRQVMDASAPRVSDWVRRMNDPEAQSFGPLCVDDEVPATLEPMLRDLFRHHWPEIEDSWGRLAEHHAAHPDAATMPRLVGRHGFELEGVRSTRAVQSYTPWMSQRSLDAAGRLNEQDRDWLRGLGGGAFLDFVRPFGLVRERGRVRVAG